MTATIENLTPQKLTERFGARERWFRRKLPEMRRQGVVAKRGRLYFGSFEAVAKWLQNSDSRNTHA